MKQESAPRMNVEELKPTVILTDGSDVYDFEELELLRGGEEARRHLEKAVDTNLDEFADFFCKELGNDPLTKAERAVVKTYLAWQFGLGPQKEQKDAEEDSR